MVDIVRVAPLHKGDVISVPKEAIDKTVLQLVAAGVLKPVEDRVTYKRKFIFFKKRINYIIFEVLKGEM